MEGSIRICAPPGTFVDPTTVLSLTDQPPTEQCRQDIVNAFTIARSRDFRHDPRFGVIVLSEIASRALSPAVNDPGSAIAVLAAGQRLVHSLLKERAEEHRPESAVGWPLFLDELVEDLVLPIARDGAGMAEVGIRMQSMLGWIGKAAAPARHAMEALSSDALERARAAGMAPTDLERVERSRRRAFQERSA